MTSIARRVHERALRHPDAVAVSDGPRPLTYAQLDAGAAAVAESLSRKGVGPGDAVAVGLPRSAELVLVMLGVLRLGGQVVPLDRQSPPARRDVILADAGAAAVVHDGLPGLPPLTPAELLAGTTEAGAPAEPAPASFLFYTSGTTGRPKGVEVRDAGVLRLAEPGWLDRGTRFACLANPAFDAISFEVWVPLLTGGTCVVLDDDTVRDPRAFADALVRERVDTMFVTATLFNAVAETVPHSFATVRRVLIGGEQLNAPLVRRWYRANPDARTRLQNGYGPTETTTFALSHLIPRDFDGDVVPIGRPLPGTGAVAVTDDDRVASEGEVAELYISGAGVAAGYRGLPAETARRFVRLPWLDEGRARFYRTGDLVRVLPGGRFAYAGRTDRQVKVRGFRIEPGELEQRLLAHPEVRQAHVAVRRAATAELLAFVVAGDLSFDALEAHLAATVPSYMRPHHVFRVEELPRNANGKVDEAGLLAGGHPPWRPATDGAATPWEREVLDVVADVLGIPDARPGDTWLRSGGDSLKALRLRFAVRERWGADLAPSVVQRGTFADLAAAVSAAGRAAYPAPDPPANATAAPATSEQQRLWLLWQRNPASTAYHVPLAFRVTGDADVGALRRDVRGLVARHPALRTAFEATPEGLRQVAKAPYDPWTEPDDDFFTAPFDLASARLLRAAWRPEHDGSGTLLLCLHHIAVDGWSLNILFRELSGAPPRPGTHTPFDFAGWQSRWFASPGYRAQREALTARLDDDAVPTGEASLAGRLRTTTIGRERVDEWAGELGLTRFQLLLGVFAWSLYAVTGRTRPRIAAPVANRPVREFEDAVGMFANTVRLPLSVDPDEDPDTQLRRLGEASAAALDHQDVAFADLEPAQAAFDYLFVLENTDFAALRLPGCTVGPQWIEAADAKCALTLSVVERPDGLDCLWEYGEGHFTEAEVEALGQVFARALDGTAATPAELAEPYRRGLPDHGRAAAAELAWDTVAEGFARQAARTPEAPALTGDTTLSYAELDAHAARLAAVLPDDATDVALYFRPSAEHVVALLALARLNITAVPLDPGYPSALLRDVLGRVRPRCVLLAPADAAAFDAIDTTVERRFVTLAGGPVPDVPVRHAGRPLYTLFTSGSTGVPKGVRVPDRTLANLLQWQDAPPAATQQFSMLSFDVSFQEIFTTLCGGGHLHLIRPGWRHDVPALLARLETARIERIFLPYVALQLLAEHGVRLGRYPSRLRDVITAGEQLGVHPGDPPLVRGPARRTSAQPLRPDRDPRRERTDPRRRPGAVAGAPRHRPAGGERGAAGRRHRRRAPAAGAGRRAAHRRARGEPVLPRRTGGGEVRRAAAPVLPQRRPRALRPRRPAALRRPGRPAGQAQRAPPRAGPGRGRAAAAPRRRQRGRQRGPRARGSPAGRVPGVSPDTDRGGAGGPPRAAAAAARAGRPLPGRGRPSTHPQREARPGRRRADTRRGPPADVRDSVECAGGAVRGGDRHADRSGRDVLRRRRHQPVVDALPAALRRGRVPVHRGRPLRARHAHRPDAAPRERLGAGPGRRARRGGRAGGDRRDGGPAARRTGPGRVLGPGARRPPRHRGLRRRRGSGRRAQPAGPAAGVRPGALRDQPPGRRADGPAAAAAADGVRRGAGPRRDRRTGRPGRARRGLR
jgi:amino acid adenylation domain-containing protein